MIKNTEVIIRMANTSDARTIQKIYEPYVKNTAITFEYEVPTVEEFESRISKTLTRFPFLVAVRQNETLGYAYASPFKARKAYDWSVETSIYVNQNARGMGAGRQLYNALEAILKQQNILNVNACIAYPAEADPHLTTDSVKFHEHMGYKLCGRFHNCGYKFQHWYDIVWMEKMIGEHMQQQPDVIPIGKIDVEAALTYEY